MTFSLFKLMDIEVVLTVLSFLGALAYMIFLIWRAKSKLVKAMYICFGAFVLLLMGLFIISSLDLLVGSPWILKIYLGLMFAFFIAGAILAVLAESEAEEFNRFPFGKP